MLVTVTIIITDTVTVEKNDFFESNNVHNRIILIQPNVYDHDHDHDPQQIYY